MKWLSKTYGHLFILALSWSNSKCNVRKISLTLRIMWWTINFKFFILQPQTPSVNLNAQLPWEQQFFSFKRVIKNNCFVFFKIRRGKAIACDNCNDINWVQLTYIKLSINKYWQSFSMTDIALLNMLVHF